MSEAALADQEGIRRAECGQCGGLRKCDVRGHHRQTTDYDGVQYSESWRILQCRGCDYVFVQKAASDSESWYYEVGPDGEQYPEVVETYTYWPALSKRKKPEWIKDGGIDAPDVDKLDEGMLELYGALGNDLNVLAGIAIRTCFDVASELLKVDPAVSFQEKLDDLVKKGHIGVRDRTRIETLVDAGSASAHRGWKPRSQDLNTMTEILEHFVHDAFVAPARKARLDERASKMKEGVPPRPPRKPRPEPKG